MKFSHSLLACGIAALLGACGGGGGGSTTAAPTPPVVSTVINGNAIKGPMGAAKISVYKTTADGKQGDLLTETTSDASGRYTISITGYSGLVIIVASVVPGTTMYDEATGTVVTPTAGFAMRAALSTEAGKTYSAQINPFTELATAQALAGTSGLTATALAQTQKDLTETLGFDPTSTTAEFDATSKLPKNPLALSLSAVSEMAKAGEIGCASGSQATRVECVVKGLVAKGLGDVAVKIALQAQSDTVADRAGIPVLKITQPAGIPVTQASAVAQAKVFFGTLRSNAKALDAADLSLQTELKKVSEDMSNRTVTLASSGVDALSLAFQAAQLWNDVIGTANATFVVSKTFTNSTLANSSCSFYSDSNYSTAATSKANANFLACSVTQLTRTQNACLTTGAWCFTAMSTRIRLHPNLSDANKFTIYSQTRKTKLNRQSDGFIRETVNANGSFVDRIEYGAPFPGNAATLAVLRDTNGKVTSVDLKGELSPSYSVENGIAADGGPVVTVLGDKHNVALNAVLTKIGQLNKLALSGSIDLIKAGALDTRLELSEGSNVQATVTADGLTSPSDGSQEIFLRLKASTLNSAVIGDLKFSAFKSDASNVYAPTLISFGGSVQRNGLNFFEGALTIELLNTAAFQSAIPRSANNVQIVRTGFTGKVSIPNRPAINLNLTVINRDAGSTANNTSDVSGQYRQGSIVVNMLGNTSGASEVLNLESTEGIKMVVDISKSTYSLTKGADSVGEYSPATNRITYSDGTFEQF